MTSRSSTVLALAMLVSAGCATGGNGSKGMFAGRPRLEARMHTNHEESGNVFRSGDELTVAITPALDCHARLFYVTSIGEIYQIAPAVYSAGARRLKAGETGYFPDALDRDKFVLAPPGGTDRIIACLSREPFGDDGLKRTIPAGSSFAMIEADARNLERTYAAKTGRNFVMLTTNVHVVDQTNTGRNAR